MKQVTLGECTVPVGSAGPWAIEEFEISPSQATLYNIGQRGYAHVGPGRYKRLVHAKRGTVMSNTPMEVRTHRGAVQAAHGRVLIAGLGMGMVLEAILAKPDVQSVVVVEIDPDVIALVGPHFDQHLATGRLQIVQADIFAWKPDTGDSFNFWWFDIWNDICGDNLPHMTKLARRFARQPGEKRFWSKVEIKAFHRYW
jgi:hypothetical protein